MSIVAHFTVPLDAVALGETFPATPEMRLEVERLATHSREWVMPFAWASGGDFEAFEDALADDPSVDERSVVDAFDGTRLYEIKWVESVGELVDEIVDQHGTILEASAAPDGWFFRIRFTDQSQVEAFSDHFSRRGVSFEVQQLTRPTDPRQATYELTENQRETLVLAQRAGYFEVPRAVSLSDLADRIGVSSNSLSERLRRGTDALVRNALVVEDRDEADDAEGE
ncbi:MULTISPECIES: helix-turn-helix domain-containing protein [Halorussus]|uniref:helix-turn-helix domain-containing protein n=1 Tax=Halorussus TaxID=1070314 RepID=UPI000E210899|nr:MULTISPECIES: helix-turn-helix domain-containing protein [Halorussus]NHN61150.1 bacterio-opsin activator [Halorussus sp. JP-T4]